MKILVVEDEHRIAQALRQGLEQESHAVDVATDGQEGYNSASNDEYDLIVLDVMMPKLNGYEVCKKLRAEGNHTPIIMLTAKSQKEDIVKGLDSGADDYLAKPFAFDELLARVRALLRRPVESSGELLRAKDLELNPADKTVARGHVGIKLSVKEYSILEYLLRNKNKVVSKDNIMSHVWNFDSDILPNNVEVFITYLRSKIDKPFKGPKIIETVRGFGYTIKD